MEIIFKDDIKKKSKNIIIDADMTEDITHKKDYTDDGLPTIEKQLRDIDLKDREMKQNYDSKEKEIYNREMKQRVKCLSLHKMGLSIFTNTLLLNTDNN